MTSISFMFVRVAHETLAIPASVTRQVVAYDEVASLPATRGNLLGLIPAVGRAIPLVDISALLGHQDVLRTELAVLLDIEDTLIALPIEEVLGFESSDPPQDKDQAISDPIELESGSTEVRVLFPRRFILEMTRRLGIL